MAERVPVSPGLLVDAEPPALVGGRCAGCGRPHFPSSPMCPYCSSSEVSEERFTGPGQLWAHTAVTAAPPGYSGEVPYGFGVVELPEGIRVVTRLTETDPSRLATGQPMFLVIVPLHVDDEGREVVTYAFAAGA
ncbi:MAG TPA: OB-fold domain-containing protein [Acidimicrobiales bacterium]|nr:OB-fold domain-containing protein [Acidimicrobiales bacterium]